MHHLFQDDEASLRGSGRARAASSVVVPGVSCEKPTVISLYSGAGGLDHGFHAAGFETAVAVEYDPTCCATLRRNFKAAVFERSIHDVSSEDILESTRISLSRSLRPGEPDVLIGGPPCQPFSKAGYWAKGDSLRLEDPRAGTIQAYLRVLAETRPKAFLLENVEGLSYSGKSEAVDLIRREIAKINSLHGTKYRPSWKVVCAADYGVPQVRNRFIMVGFADGTEFEFPQASFEAVSEESVQTPLPTPRLPAYRTAWDALWDLDENENEELAPRGKWAGLLPSVPEGQNYLWFTPRGGGRPLFGWRTRYWSFLLKLAKNKPSWTIPAQPGPAIGPFHWKSRRLSPRELCRLQTFPDHAEVVGGLSAVQKQLGNAVPSLLGEVLARSIRKQGWGEAGSAPESRTPTLLRHAETPTPPAEPVARVPAEYLKLEDENHAPHGGTGTGPRARQEWASPPT